jgi:DNA-binding CsgD family transcriptional regulator
VDDSILSLFRDVSPGRVRVLAFKRAWGEPAFGAEEREIVHLAHGECGWALQPLPAVNPPLAAGWPPKERETFALLLTGATEEEIASTLGLAPPAVHVYVQEIQRRLGVTTRAEMVAAAFVRRD